MLVALPPSTRGSHQPTSVLRHHDRGIDGKPQRVKCIGDLPACVRDNTGFWRRVIIRNVRCVPTFTDTLISVDQFWEESKVNCVFNDARCIHVPGGGDQASMDLPFARMDNLYRWAIVPVNRDPRLQRTSDNRHMASARSRQPFTVQCASSQRTTRDAASPPPRGIQPHQEAC